MLSVDSRYVLIKINKTICQRKRKLAVTDTIQLFAIAL